MVGIARKRKITQSAASLQHKSFISKIGSGQFPQKSGAETDFINAEKELWKRRARNDRKEA